MNVGGMIVWLVLAAVCAYMIAFVVGNLAASNRLFLGGAWFGMFWWCAIELMYTYRSNRQPSDEDEDEDFHRRVRRRLAQRRR